MSIISRYSVTNPNFLHLEEILENYVDDYKKKFGLSLILCKWNLQVSDIIINVKSDRLFNILRGWNLRSFLLSKIKYFERYGHKFSHVSKVYITFITDLRNMTYEHSLNQSKPMVERRLNEKVSKNPEFV